MDLLYNLSSKFNPEISSGTSSKLYMIDTVTELGFCHSINTKIAGYNSYKWDWNARHALFDQLFLLLFYHDDNDINYYSSNLYSCFIHKIQFFSSSHRISYLNEKFLFAYFYVFTISVCVCPICTNMCDDEQL